MQQTNKFILPSPVFEKSAAAASKHNLHFLTPSGMTLLPREKQPPPMYGPRGATVAPRYLRPPYQQQQKPQRGKFNNNQSWQQNRFAKQAPLAKRSQYCEACEMDLPSQQEYHAHTAAHKSCPIAGCRYRGLAIVMEKHIATIHTSGLFDKLKKMDTPEEIAAWREERRKRYPTLANVMQRMQAKEQRQKRGERLEENKSRFAKREDRNRPPKRKRKNFKQKQKQIEKLAKLETKEQKENKGKLPQSAEQEESENECCGVIAFKGTRQLKQYKHMPTKQNALTNLLSAYGSDSDNVTDDEEMDEHVEIPICKVDNKAEDKIFAPVPNDLHVMNNEDGNEKLLEVVKENISADLTEKVSVEEAGDDEEAPEEMPIQHSSDLPLAAINKLKAVPAADTAQTAVSTASTVVDINRKRQLLQQQQRKAQIGLDYRKAKLRKQNTMLEKLLETDIRHERNVLLQCVRFVCEQQFFGIGAAK